MKTRFFKGEKVVERITNHLQVDFKKKFRVTSNSRSVRARLSLFNLILTTVWKTHPKHSSSQNEFVVLSQESQNEFVVPSQEHLTKHSSGFSVAHLSLMKVMTTLMSIATIVITHSGLTITDLVKGIFCANSIWN